METTILQDVKNSIGINPDVEDPVFDASIVMHINSAIAELAELGVREQGKFTVENRGEAWSEYLGDDLKYLTSLVKEYICTYVKLYFDNNSGTMNSALEEQKNRLEFRIMTTIERHED